MVFIGPVGFRGFKSPQHTSKRVPPDAVGMSIFFNKKGLSIINVMATPPPRLLGLGVEIY